MQRISRKENSAFIDSILKEAASKYQVNERKHPQIKPKKVFEGSKDKCVNFVKKKYRGLKQHSFFDDSSFYKGDGAYYTNAQGLEVSIGPA